MPDVDIKSVDFSPIDLARGSLTFEIPLELVEQGRAKHLSEQAEDFRTELLAIRSMGHPVTLVAQLNVGISSDRARFQDEMPGRLVPEDALGAFTPGMRGLKDVVPELCRLPEPIAVSPFRIRSSDCGQNKVLVEVVDLLDPKSPVIFSEEFPAETIAGKRAQILEQIEPLLQERVAKDQVFVDTLAPSPGRRERSVYYTDPEASVSAEERECRRELFSEYPEVTFDATRHGDEMESREEGASPIVHLLQPELDKMHYAPIVARGRANSIALQRKIPLEAGEEGVEVFPRDRFGNSISLVHQYAPDKKGLIETIFIEPPTAFESAGTPETAQRAISFDLSALRLGEIHGMFVDQPEIALNVPGQPAVFSNVDSAKVQAELQKAIPLLQSTAVSTAELFGQADRMKNIYIVDARCANGFFRKNNPDTIILTDAFVRDSSAAKLVLGTAHETFHLLDGSSGFALSDGAFAEQFNSLAKTDKDFLRMISESFFYRSDRNNYKLGHADENQKEFFASFLNSMRHPDWQRCLETFPPGFHEKYLQTLRALGSSISAGGISDDAPIAKEIADKIAYLEKRIAQGLDPALMRDTGYAPAWVPPAVTMAKTPRPDQPQDTQHEEPLLKEIRFPRLHRLFGHGVRRFPG